jgi:peptidylprolyl isomerase
MSSNTQEKKPFGTRQSQRLLGNAIALAAVTGLMAYGCEKAQSQKAESQKARQSQASSTPPATAPKELAAAPQPGKPATPPVADATPAAPPPTLVSANPADAKPAEDPNTTPEQPKAPAIPHEELAKDAKPLGEFTTPTNVIVQDFKKGEGFPTLPKAVATMHFVLRLKDGWKKIQSTWEDGAPETYQLDEVVLGMADGIIGMTPGATRRIIVPPERGFGEKGVKDKKGNVVIPPNATLVYDVDLISNKQKIVEGQQPKPVVPKFNSGRKDEGGK